MNKHQDFTGKTVWILGASSGIGASLAHEIAARGGRVALSARRQEKLEDVLQSLAGQGHISVPLDVSDSASVNDAFDYIKGQFENLDSAVFMAASYSPHDGAQKDINLIHQMLRVNLGGAFNMLDALQPYFKARQRGQIVLCASVAGYRGLPTGQPYCAAKAALINLAESTKLEMERYHVDVKLINPGFVKTPLTDKNDFKMPMIIAPEVAGKAIADGLLSTSFEIHFPKRFTYIMKLIRALPATLYFMLARRLR